MWYWALIRRSSILFTDILFIGFRSLAAIDDAMRMILSRHEVPASLRHCCAEVDRLTFQRMRLDERSVKNLE